DADSPEVQSASQTEPAAGAEGLVTFGPVQVEPAVAQSAVVQSAVVQSAVVEPAPQQAVAVPTKKPDFKIAQKVSTPQEVSTPQKLGEQELDVMRATLVELEDQMRALDIAGRKDEAKMLSAQYVALKSDIERYEYASPEHKAKSAAVEEPQPVVALAEVAPPRVYEHVSHLNEAQIQERAVQRQKEAFAAQQGVPVQDVPEQAVQQEQSVPELAVSEVQQEQIVMRESADPFAELAVNKQVPE